jgi:hypothetical protein
MRLFTLIPVTFITATLAMTDAAAAQNWQEYSYPDYSFRVSFPAEPQIEATTYQITGDRTAVAHVYAVYGKDAVFKVTVAELGDPAPEETAVIDHAITTLSAGGEVKVNIPHRINRVFGRQLSILQRDGGRTSVALFDYNGRFYQIESTSLAGANDATAEAIRFVQSLIFTGGGSNRSPTEALAACNTAPRAGSSAAASSAPSAPDRARFFELRCRRQQALAGLVSALNSADLPGAQRAYASLAEIPDGGAGRFGNPNGPFAQAVKEIGQALQSGDLSGAQQALSSLRRGRGANREPR